MHSDIDTYLKKRAIANPWLLEGAAASDADCVFVIPALAESAFLFNTLDALRASAKASQTDAQVIVVVNNRDIAHGANPADIADNAKTLESLHSFAAQEHFAPLSLAWVDASSPGYALPAKDGVGLARKIGGDHALRLLRETGRLDTPIVHLDADSSPAPGYCDALHRFYRGQERWGGYASYRHPIEAPDTPTGQAMLAYEIYMRYHEIALRWAGSPYAYPALGSIMSSTARAYAAAGGMNRRQAGEDFYFMQQLVKTGRLEAIPGALVYPAGRCSERTPFGTGRVVAAESRATLFHPDSYRVLRDWLTLAAAAILQPGMLVRDEANAIHPELGRFLDARNFPVYWDKIAANHSTSPGRLRQFHVWFDGLRTIQLIHHLRDTAFPDVAAPDAVAALLERIGCEDSRTVLAHPLRTLETLRRISTVSLSA